MFKSKGRSGIGDTSIQSTWEDFQGLSPNGREFKNVLTQETRSLSGAEYWEARKANYPSERPTITTAKKKTSKTAFSQIMLADRHYDRMEKLSEGLEDEYELGQIDHTDYAIARRKMDERLHKAWLRVCRDKNWSEEVEEAEQPRTTAEDIAIFVESEQRRLDAWTGQPEKVNKNKSEKVLTDPRFWHTVFASLEESNFFRKLYFKIKG